MWDAHVCIYDNCACTLAETLKLSLTAIFELTMFFALAETLKLSLTAIFELTMFFVGYMLVRIDTTFAQSLNVWKQI